MVKVGQGNKPYEITNFLGHRLKVSGPSGPGGGWSGGSPAQLGDWLEGQQSGAPFGPTGI